MVRKNIASPLALKDPGREEETEGETFSGTFGGVLGDAKFLARGSVL